MYENKLLFFDYDQKVVDALREKFKTVPGVSFVHTDVRKLPRTHHVDLIVSPANSIGWMDGGIDDYYRQLFPGIQSVVQDKIKTYGIPGRPPYWILPIGSAVIVPTNFSSENYKNMYRKKKKKNLDKYKPISKNWCPQLICSPTMEEPDNIEGTQNPYFAFLSVLYVTRKMEGQVVAVPGLGTGCGNISPEEAAEQMYRAYQDFIASDDPLELFTIPGIEIVKNKPGELVVSRHICEQRMYG